MGIMVYSLLWVMQDFVHQSYVVLFVLISLLLIVNKPHVGGPLKSNRAGGSFIV